MPSIILVLMKWCCAFLALSLLAQHSEKEQALGRGLAQELRREAKPIPQGPATAYLKQAAARLSPHIEVELVEIRAADPMPLPGGMLFVPANTLRNAASETDFLRALAHAIAHIELRHGFQQKSESNIPVIFMGSWSGIHPDPIRPTAMPIAFRKHQARFEQEAAAYALQKVPDQPDSAAFLEARRSLQP